MRTVIQAHILTPGEKLLFYGKLTNYLYHYNRNPEKELNIPLIYLEAARSWYNHTQNHPGIGLTSLMEDWGIEEIMAELRKELPTN